MVNFYTAVNKSELWVENEQELFQKYLKEFLFAAEKITGTVKCQHIKNYVADIIYSKETIQINIYWPPTIYNREGRLEDAMEKSDAHPQDDCAKSIYSNRIGDIENGLMYRKTAGGADDDPRRSAEGRGAEEVNRRSVSEGGIFPSEELCSERGADIFKTGELNRFEKLDWLPSC